MISGACLTLPCEAPAVTLGSAHLNSKELSSSQGGLPELFLEAMDDHLDQRNARLVDEDPDAIDRMLDDWRDVGSDDCLHRL